MTNGKAFSLSCEWLGLSLLFRMKKTEIFVFAPSIIRLRSAKIFKPNGRGILQTIILMTIKRGNSPAFLRFNTLKCGRPTMGVMAGFSVLSSLLKFFAESRGLKRESTSSQNGPGTAVRSRFPARYTPYGFSIWLKPMLKAPKIFPKYRGTPPS